MNNGFYIGSILIVSYEVYLNTFSLMKIGRAIKSLNLSENRKGYQKPKFKWLLPYKVAEKNYYFSQSPTCQLGLNCLWI